MNAAGEYAKNQIVKSLLTDPIVLGCVGVMVAGLLGLIWALGRFRKLAAPSPDDAVFQDPIASISSLPDIPAARPSPIPVSVPTPSASPAVSREVADRLESMTQRLSEMQNVLMKQASGGAPGAPAAGGMGQGFSPETIDKLLKIVGNVIQQVDILNKSLNTPK